MRPVLLFLLLVGPALAGCAGPAATPNIGPEANATAPPVVEYADLAGSVLDLEETPIQGATVLVEGAAEPQITNADGRFLFEHLATGPHQLSAAHGDYVPLTQTIGVLSGTSNSVTIKLELLPDRRPYLVTSTHTGNYDCALESFIYTGDCVPTGSLGLGPPPGSTSKYVFPFQAGSRWNQILVELTWTEGASYQLDGMHVYLAPGNETDPFGHHTKMAVAEGSAQPLKILVTNGVAHPTAEKYENTGTVAVVPTTGGPLQVLVYPRGKFSEYFGQVCDNDGRCFLGIGAALNIRFNVYITTSYNQMMPAGFTAVLPG